jgi:hypothetical protein
MYMRLKLLLVAFVSLFLVLLGLCPDAVPYLRHDARYSDAVLAHWPNAFFLRESVLDRSEFPLWRETTMAGQPFAANPLNKTAYPPQWLALIFPPALHLNVLILLHLLIAGAGMWMWVRSLGRRMEAVFLSTAAYILAPRLFAHLGTGHLDTVYALAWWPWLMWSMRQLVLHTRWQNIIMTDLFAAMTLLADVRVSLFAFASAGVYALIELWRGGAWKRVPAFAAAGVLTIPLTLALIVPLVVWQPYMSRANMQPSDAGVLALQPVHLLGLILPAHRPSVETLTYLGLPVLVMAIIGIISFSRRIRWAWLGLALFVILYAMGENAFIWPLLVRLFPPLLWFRVPSKIWLVFVLLTPLLAGYGLHWLLNFLENRNVTISVHVLRRSKLAIVAGMTVTVACGIFALLALRLPPTMGISAVVGGLSLGILLLLAFNRKIKPPTFAALLIILACLDLAWTGYQWADWRGEDVWLDPGRPLAERLVAEGADRIYSPTYSLEQQVAEVYQLRLFGGVDPFQLAGIVEAVEQGSGVPVTKYDPVLPPLGGAESDADVAQANQGAVIDTAILAEWGVSHIVAAYPLDDERLQPVDVVNGVYIYANQDYTPRSISGAVPDWPLEWLRLPDAQTVANLNQITLTAWLISGTSFLICLLVLIVGQLRTKRD